MRRRQRPDESDPQLDHLRVIVDLAERAGMDDSDHIRSVRAEIGERESQDAK